MMCFAVFYMGNYDLRMALCSIAECIVNQIAYMEFMVHHQHYPQGKYWGDITSFIMKSVKMIPFNQTADGCSATLLTSNHYSLNIICPRGGAKRDGSFSL